MITTPGQLNRRAELYHQLGSMVGAGVPLIKSLEMVRNSPAIGVSRSTVEGLIHSLQAGLTFTESMQRIQGWMPDFDIALLAVGEESGRLDGSFKLLSAHYAARASIIRDTIAGLITTLATLHVFLLIFPLSLLIALVQGIMLGDWRRCLPFLVEKVIVFGGLYTGTFLLIYAMQGQRAEVWRSMVETITRVIPILGKARWYLALARLSGALEAATAAGVSIFKSWELAGAASGSPQLRREVDSWRMRLEGGVTPAELINQSHCFPEMFANLYHTAELDGRIDEALHRLQMYYQEEGFRALRLFTRMMNGTIYGFLVLVVAYTVVTFYIGYFKQMWTF